MTILEFEAKIKREIDKRLTIKRNPNHSDISGVYINDIYLGVAVPPNEIMPKRSDFYMDTHGYPYRGVEEAMKDIKGKVETWSQDKQDLHT